MTSEIEDRVLFGDCLNGHGTRVAAMTGLPYRTLMYEGQVDSAALRHKCSLHVLRRVIGALATLNMDRAQILLERLREVADMRVSWAAVSGGKLSFSAAAMCGRMSSLVGHIAMRADQELDAETRQFLADEARDVRVMLRELEHQLRTAS